jgi:hypothetical protein
MARYVHFLVHCIRQFCEITCALLVKSHGQIHAVSFTLNKICKFVHIFLDVLPEQEKAGQDLKLFHRSVSTLKEMCIRNMSL